MCVRSLEVALDAACLGRIVCRAYGDAVSDEHPLSSSSVTRSAKQVAICLASVE